MMDLGSGTTTAEYISLYSIKSDPTFFDQRRKEIFHYCVFVNANPSGSSGAAEIWGNDFGVTLADVTDYVCDNLQDATSENALAGTFIHELGHNLDLHHGGIENNAEDMEERYKPNQPSSMNYRYQFAGISSNCDLIPDGALGYSQGMLRMIDEQHVNEQVGICDRRELDLNCNGRVNTTTRAINVNASVFDDDTMDRLFDYDEWGGLQLNFRINGTRWRAD